MTPAGRVQPYSTGSSYLYIAFGGRGNTRGPYFFGTCEGYPKHERRMDWMQLMNDTSGRKKPMDMSFQGYDATISLDMTVWDDGIAQMLEQLPDMSGLTGTATPGSYFFSDVGTLMGFEQCACQLWIAYGNTAGIGGQAPKAAYTGGKLPGGYRYYQCLPFAPITAEEGAQGEIKSVNFYAWPVANWQATPQPMCTLFDNNMNAIQNIPFNGPIAA